MIKLRLDLDPLELRVQFLRKGSNLLPEFGEFFRRVARRTFPRFSPVAGFTAQTFGAGRTDRTTRTTQAARTDLRTGCRATGGLRSTLRFGHGYSRVERGA